MKFMKTLSKIFLAAMSVTMVVGCAPKTQDFK